MRYYCEEHLESSLDDRDQTIGFAKYVVKASLIEDGSLEDITINDIEGVQLFDHLGKPMDVGADRMSEISKWLEDEAMEYLCSRRDVDWVKIEDSPKTC